MSLYRPAGSKVWRMDFMFHGQRINETTHMTSITRARAVQDKRKQDLREGAAGIRKPPAPRLLFVAAEDWLERKRPRWSDGTGTIAKTALGHLLPVLGKRLVVDLEASDIASYQKARLFEGASNRTVNIEVGMLRQIMRLHGAWARIQMHVAMLPESQDMGYALTALEESCLLVECNRSRSRILFPFVLLALETGARRNTIRTLQWRNIDFLNRCLKFGKDKTAAGTGRIVPLTQRALGTLKFWAEYFPNRLPEHYVFPLERVGAAGDKFEAKVYATDPTKPVGSIKEAWETAKRQTRRHCPHCNGGILADKPKPGKGYACIECRTEMNELPAGLVRVRFHDLRHTAVSRMIAGNVPLPIIAKIVGWSAGTMAKMAARYGHFGIEELRSAVETISRNHEQIALGSSQKSQQLEVETGRDLAN